MGDTSEDVKCAHCTPIVLPTSTNESAGMSQCMLFQLKPKLIQQQVHYKNEQLYGKFSSAGVDEMVFKCTCFASFCVLSISTSFGKGLILHDVGHRQNQTDQTFIVMPFQTETSRFIFYIISVICLCFGMD